MNWDQIKGNWKQWQGKAQQQWGKLTNDDLDVIIAFDAPHLVDHGHHSGGRDRGVEHLREDRGERQYLARVMEAVAGNKSAAARILGIDRKRLYRMLDRLARLFGDDPEDVFQGLPRRLLLIPPDQALGDRIGEGLARRHEFVEQVKLLGQYWLCVNRVPALY